MYGLREVKRDDGYKKYSFKIVSFFVVSNLAVARDLSREVITVARDLSREIITVVRNLSREIVFITRDKSRATVKKFQNRHQKMFYYHQQM